MTTIDVTTTGQNQLSKLSKLVSQTRAAVQQHSTIQHFRPSMKVKRDKQHVPMTGNRANLGLSVGKGSITNSRDVSRENTQSVLSINIETRPLVKSNSKMLSPYNAATAMTK